MKKIFFLFVLGLTFLSCSKDVFDGNFFNELKDTTWVSLESVTLEGKSGKVFISVGKDGSASQGYQLENGDHISCRSISTEDYIGIGGYSEIIKNSKSIFISKNGGTSEPIPTVGYFILSKSNNQIKYIHSSNEDVNDISSYDMEYTLVKTSMNYETSMSKCVD